MYLLRPRPFDNWQGVFFLDGVKIVVRTQTSNFIEASSAARRAEETIRRFGLLDQMATFGTA